MLFQEGNEYWKQRKNVGKPKAIKDPEELWNLACDYFQSIDDNPVSVQDNKGTKNVNTIKLKVPYTWAGLQDYVFEKISLWGLDDYKKNKDGRYADYTQVIHRIDNIMANQKYTGAVIGIFKENIIARDLGLKDHKELDVKVPVMSDKSAEELMQKVKDADKQ